MNKKFNKMSLILSEAEQDLPDRSFIFWLGFCFGLFGEDATKEQLRLIDDELKRLRNECGLRK